MAGIGTVAIIGAGMSGLACARALVDGGVDVVVIDKGRGLGGRIATRRGTLGAVDHGAVALHASDAAVVQSCAGQVSAVPGHASGQGIFAPDYLAYLKAAAEQGAAAFWPVANGWVGLPGMSAIVQPLARGVAVQVATEVTGLERLSKGWRLHGDGVPQTQFDQVVLAIPYPQALGLLGPWPALHDRIRGARMRAVWTAMARFDQPLPIPDDLIRDAHGPIAQAVRTSAKPGRTDDTEAWVLHAAADWTAAHLELDKPAAATLLLAAFFAQLGLTPVAPIWLEGHRWRYGLTEQALGQAFVRDAGLGLSVCGDWCLGDTAGDAFASGQAVAAALLGQ